MAAGIRTRELQLRKPTRQPLRFTAADEAAYYQPRLFKQGQQLIEYVAMASPLHGLCPLLRQKKKSCNASYLDLY